MNFNRRASLKLLSTAGLLTAASGTFLLSNPLVPVAKAEDLSDLMNLAPDENILGSVDAPVTIIEYASMTCSHCATFHAKTLPDIKEKYVKTGKAKLVFREFPVSTKDLRSIAAFMLARCADDDKYFPMIDVLFKQQAQWARAEDPIPILLNISKLAGFTQKSFNACLKNQQVMDTVLAVRNKAEDDYGVSGTPTFFIDGKKHVGTASVEEFSKLIEDAL
ncbi:MAG: DsbA family protein [Hyphomicrobiales bacterium]|nr:DsbA family protein [Hyphomicrobiales bacterium]